MVKVSKSAQVLVVNILISIILLSAFLGGSKVGKKPSQLKKLKKFKSCRELYQKLIKFASGYSSEKLAQEYSFGRLFKARWGQATMLSSLNTDSITITRENKYSKTNVQVEGVDEADIVKTDGNYLYIVSNERVAIVKAYPPEDAKLLSIIPFSASERPLELFVEKDKLLTISNSGESRYYHFPYLQSRYYHSPYLQNSLITRIYDISNRSKPTLIRKVQFEGNYNSSRKIGSFVYLILTYHPQYVREYNKVKEVALETALPRIIYGSGSKKSRSSYICPCRNVKYIDPLQTANFLIVASISLESPTFHIQKEVVLGASDTVYASLNNIYIANNFYDYGRVGVENLTQIYKFSIQNGKILYKGKGEVPGKPINQFAMDEQNDFFRIATQTYSKGVPSSNVYILNKDLVSVGKLENLAKTENMHSTRFFNNRLYMVTFKRIDPLLVIDLTNPTSPKVLGELKIPGFSEYLHPIDENNIIGFGKDTVDTPKEWATPGDIKGLKIAVFDVSDPKNPKQKFVETIGDSGSNSPVLQDHKAFLFDKEKELLVFPAFIVEDKKAEKTFDGAYVYNLSIKDGFKLKGRISHYDDEEAPLPNNYTYDSNFSIKRALYINNILYTISAKKVGINKLDNLEKLSDIGF